MRFPSGSLQYTLLNLPLAPVRITVPSCEVSGARSTISTPASTSRLRTSLTLSSVRKQRSALPSLTRSAFGSNSWQRSATYHLSHLTSYLAQLVKINLLLSEYERMPGYVWSGHRDEGLCSHAQVLRVPLAGSRDGLHSEHQVVQ